MSRSTEKSIKPRLHPMTITRLASAMGRPDTAGILTPSMLHCCSAGTNSSAATLFYSIRASAGVSGPLQGRGLADSPPTAPAGDEALLGQLEWVEAGTVSGWACVRGAPNQVLKV